ncbi:hypothetical protein BdWA1_001001 [Babesia duncani]|uniref:Uncharacterized protein n=1 Tax=Babesia duncani TaxID=323732 RepID=A0AAD9UQL3_9APIC|nr:hypothetical protein BdWA1_001001 [Babesia duncani]
MKIPAILFHTVILTNVVFNCQPIEDTQQTLTSQVKVDQEASTSAAKASITKPIIKDPKRASPTSSTYMTSEAVTQAKLKDKDEDSLGNVTVNDTMSDSSMTSVRIMLTRHQNRKSFLSKLILCGRLPVSATSNGNVHDDKYKLYNDIAVCYKYNIQVLKNLKTSIILNKTKMAKVLDVLRNSFLDKSMPFDPFLSFKQKSLHMLYVLDGQIWNFDYMRLFYIHCLRYIHGNRANYDPSMQKMLSNETNSHTLDMLKNDRKYCANFTLSSDVMLLSSIRYNIEYTSDWIDMMEVYLNDKTRGYMNKDIHTRQTLQKIAETFDDNMFVKEKLYGRIHAIPKKLVNYEFFRFYNNYISQKDMKLRKINEGLIGGHSEPVGELERKVSDVVQRNEPQTIEQASIDYDIITENQNVYECIDTINAIRVETPKFFDKYANIPMKYDLIIAHCNGGKTLINGSIGVDTNFDDLPYGMVETAFKTFVMKVENKFDETEISSNSINFAKLDIQNSPYNVIGANKENIQYFCNSSSYFLEINIAKLPQINQLIDSFMDIAHYIESVLKNSTLQEVVEFKECGDKIIQEIFAQIDDARVVTKGLKRIMFASLCRSDMVRNIMPSLNPNDIKELLDSPIIHDYVIDPINIVNFGIIIYHHMRLLYKEMKDINRRLVAYNALAMVVENVASQNVLEAPNNLFNSDYLTWLINIFAGSTTAFNKRYYLDTRDTFKETVDILKEDTQLYTLLGKLLTKVNVDIDNVLEYINLVTKEAKPICLQSTESSLYSSQSLSFVSNGIEFTYEATQCRRTCISNLSKYIVASSGILEFPFLNEPTYDSIRVCWNNGFHVVCDDNGIDNNFDDFVNDPLDNAFHKFKLDYELLKCEYKNSQSSFNFAKVDLTRIPSEVMEYDIQYLYNYFENARCLLLMLEIKLPAIVDVKRRQMALYDDICRVIASIENQMLDDKELLDSMIRRTIERIQGIGEAIKHVEIIIGLCKKRFEFLQTLVSISKTETLKTILDLPIAKGKGKRKITTTNFAIITHHFIRIIHWEMKLVREELTGQHTFCRIIRAINLAKQHLVEEGQVIGKRDVLEFINDVDEVSQILKREYNRNQRLMIHDLISNFEKNAERYYRLSASLLPDGITIEDIVSDLIDD